MRNFFENGFSWFKKGSAKSQSTASVGEALQADAVEEAKVELAIHRLQAVVESMTETASDPIEVDASIECAADTKSIEAPTVIVATEKIEAIAEASVESEAEPVTKNEPVTSTPPAHAAEPIVEAPAREPGPLVKTMIRGARLYATCPHCEAMWSVQERLTDPHRKELKVKTDLDCPACEKPVTLPVAQK